MNKIPFGRHGADPGQIASHAHHSGDHDRIRRVYDAGKLAFGFGTSGIDCTITELSKSKAVVRIRLQPTDIPKQVFLIHLRTKIAFEARVVSSDVEYLALELSCEHHLENPSTPVLQAMRLRWFGH